MFCKYCGKKIPDDATVCPICGQKLASEKKGNAVKIVLMVLGVAALCCVLAWAIFFGVTGKVLPDFMVPSPTTPDGLHSTSGKNDIYNKLSYSVSDADAIKKADTVVSTLGDSKLTNSMLQIMYWNQVYDFLNEYGAYASLLGMDYTKPLETQIYDAENGTSWQHYLLEMALMTWKQYAEIYNDAQKAGFQLPEESQKHLAGVHDQLQKEATDGKYDSIDAMLAKELGAGITEQAYMDYLNLYYTANMYFAEKSDSFTVSEAEIEAYFTEHEEDLKQNKITKDSAPMYDVRHILVMPTGGTKSEDGKTTVYSEQEWEDCRVKAQKILDDWLAGEATEESFAALATEKTEDPGSKSTGGLYENVEKGQMVEPFETWSMEEGRQHGDYGLVKTSYGYHVMYFVGSEASWIRYSRSGVLNDKALAFLEGLAKDSELNTTYSKIAIAVVSLG